jgi:hypothetical protein
MEPQLRSALDRRSRAAGPSRTGFPRARQGPSGEFRGGTPTSSRPAWARDFAPPERCDPEGHSSVWLLPRFGVVSRGFHRNALVVRLRDRPGGDVGSPHSTCCQPRSGGGYRAFIQHPGSRHEPKLFLEFLIKPLDSSLRPL